MNSRRTISPSTSRRLIVWFFLTEGAGVALWWIAIFWSPATRARFNYPEDADLLAAFLLPDSILLIVSALLAAWAIDRSRPWGMRQAHATAACIAAHRVVCFFPEI